MFFFFFQAEDGIRDLTVTGVQTCALPISGEYDYVTRRLTFRASGGSREQSNPVHPRAGGRGQEKRRPRRCAAGTDRARARAVADRRVERGRAGGRGLGRGGEARRAA